MKNEAISKLELDLLFRVPSVGSHDLSDDCKKILCPQVAHIESMKTKFLKLMPNRI